MEKIWLTQYPEDVAREIDVEHYSSLVEMLEESFRRNSTLPAFKFMGEVMTYAQLDADSRALAAYLQSKGFVRGDRIAIMMPNVPQYPVVVAAILRLGAVVVNINPLYTPRELEHQLQNSGSKAIFILENFACTLQSCLSLLPLKQVFITALGDMLSFPKRHLVNFVVRHVKKLVPSFDIPQAQSFTRSIIRGRKFTFSAPLIEPNDIACLQYTGGTTGVSKGAVLLHRNLIANILQSEAWYRPALKRIPANEQILTACVLPLYHIFGFNTNMMLSLKMGGCNLLIPNPRDLPAMFKELAKEKIHSFPAVNTLFNAMLNHPLMSSVDWQHLKISVGGGMAVHSSTAKQWFDKTRCPIFEGYGLSETSPVVCTNPLNNAEYTGSIGVPIPNTEVKLIDDDGNEVPQGQRGEIAIRGPQVMAGYWQRPDETAKVMTPDGFFKSGDIGVMDERGYFKIVDRKKDMILVSGFNVYPNEIEDVLTQMPGILECAAVGVPDDKTGEAVKVVIVLKDPRVTEAAIRAFCEANLTGYKRPRHFEFRTELPKSPIGKILRRELRDKPSPTQPPSAP